MEARTVKCPVCHGVNYVGEDEKFMECYRCNIKVLAAFLQRVERSDTHGDTEVPESST